jgi:hypothetical protein
VQQAVKRLKRDGVKSAAWIFRWRMILSDLPSPAEALIRTMGACEGFAQAGNRRPLFGIMR